MAMYRFHVAMETVYYFSLLLEIRNIISSSSLFPLMFLKFQKIINKLFVLSS